ncbi:hypothetical protein SAMN05216389_104100 [Oceanobacillus limi]|uniref:ABC-2 family transporter protein n=1 Tax=Oceanobacillus limi TaxID=930131 RepID=A0A1I0AYN3_9BACI|nr:hypothetical protein [Oceanobacillus limi]SES99559.1 hypothetical protein SAMN05216389_104100 [Oceanobacillus limi]
MNRYIKLVNFEFNRFLKIYLVLIGITIASQILGAIIRSNQYLNDMNDLLYEQLMTREAALEQLGKISFYHITQTVWFMGPIAICIVTLLIYMFFIWYRDWFGKNTFIYRLLMLPTARINVYFAKATTILLMVFGLVAIQLLMLPVGRRVLQWMIPVDFRVDQTIREILTSFDYLMILFPSTFYEFVIHYAIGFAVVLVVFTAILFERSFRWKGIVFGLIFGAFAVTIFIFPVIVQAFILPEFFYPIELFALECIAGLVVVSLSIWTSNYLLKKKIRV